MIKDQRFFIANTPYLSTKRSNRGFRFHDFFSAAHGSAWPRSGSGMAEGSEYEPGAPDMTGVDDSLGGGGGGPMANSCC